jgi:plasmid stabilization system protein ParE
MRVHWTDNAIVHLQDIYDYISRDSHFYAERMIDRLTGRSLQIASFPFSGRMVLEYLSEDIREVIEGPYRLIYRIRQDQIDVLAVVHGSRLLNNPIVPL